MNPKSTYKVFEKKMLKIIIKISFRKYLSLFVGFFVDYIVFNNDFWQNL